MEKDIDRSAAENGDITGTEAAEKRNGGRRGTENGDTENGGAEKGGTENGGTENGGGRERGASASAQWHVDDPRSAEEIARDRAIDTCGYGIMTKKELCYKYFPGSASPPAARKMLNRTVQRCPKLVAALRDTGYRKCDRTLTPRQVALFYYYIGEP